MMDMRKRKRMEMLHIIYQDKNKQNVKFRIRREDKLANGRSKPQILNR